MKVTRASYQDGEHPRFILNLGKGPQCLQVDALGQVAQAMSRVFKPGAEIEVDYNDDWIVFRNVDDVPEADVARPVEFSGTASVVKKA